MCTHTQHTFPYNFKGLMESMNPRIEPLNERESYVFWALSNNKLSLITYWYLSFCFLTIYSLSPLLDYKLHESRNLDSAILGECPIPKTEPGMSRHIINTCQMKRFTTVCFST